MSFRRCTNLSMAPFNQEGLQRLSSIKWIVVLALWLGVGLAAGKVPDALLGVAPADAALYEADPFSCKDASGKISLAQVNDDFCDCADGSDEPGTSACPSGRFYCRNKGYHPISIFSSRVNDGICDCCDGSDEWANPGRCTNTCLQAGAAYRAQLAQEATAYSEGNKVRKNYVSKAKKLRGQWATELEQAKAEKVKQEAIEKALKQRKEVVEAAEKAQREWREEQERAAKAAEPQPIEPETPEETDPRVQEVPVVATEEPAPAEETASDGTESVEESGKEEERGDELPRLGEEDAAADADVLSKEELGRRVASRWTHGKEAVGDIQFHEEKRKDEEQAREIQEEQEAYGEGGQEEGQEEGGEEEPLEDEEVAQILDEENVAPPEVTEDSAGSLLNSLRGFLHKVLPKALLRLLYPGPPPHVPTTEVDRLRAEYAVASAKLSELTSRQTNLESKLARDYGPDEVFAALADECFEVPVKQYKYKVCMYDAATQEENGQIVRLGSWAGWLDDYSAFQFTNGQHCWNGPMRSLKVRLRCGPKNELTNIDEPSRCEYSADLATPALCTEEVTKAVKEELASSERIAQELKEEL